MTQGASILRDARLRAGLTQTALASRAGVTQSVISAYEGGHRQPSLATLENLVEATGFELDVRVRPQPRRLAGLTGPLGRRVRHCRAELTAAAAAHDVTGLRVFGSVARGEDTDDSDVDLLVDLPPGFGLIALARLRAQFESILDTAVDVVPAIDLKPDVRRRITDEMVAL